MAIQQAAKGGFEGFSLIRVQNTYGKGFYVDFPNQPAFWDGSLTSSAFGSTLDQFEYWLFEKNLLHTLTMFDPSAGPFNNQIVILDRALNTVLNQSNALQSLSVNLTPTDDLYWVFLNLP